MDDAIKAIRERLGAEPAGSARRLVKVVAGDVATVCRAVPTTDRTPAVNSLLKGAESVPPAAEVWQQYGDLLALLTLVTE